MESGWLLADGEAVASAQRARSPVERHRAIEQARRGELAAVLRAPAIVRAPFDLIRIRDGSVGSVRTVRRVPACIVRPGLVVVVGRGDAERAGVRPGSSVELRWAP